MKRRRGQEGGFALLLVFAMAAIVAIMLYMELPRVAFEVQRDREEMLIERGEQYKRAIQLFSRRFRSYPPTIDALENTNNIRFLRRRYKDPMTGKDEWRLIHAGPGGVLLDSLTQKPPGKTDGSGIAPLDSSSSSDTPVVSMKPRVRPSEGGGVPGNPVPPPGSPDQPGPADPSGPPGASGSPGSTGVAGPNAPGAYPSVSGGITPGGPALSGNNEALAAIQKRLTTPTLMPGFSAGGQTIGGGIAGVASKLEAEGVKTYKDRRKYNEWEFVYDPRTDVPGQVGGPGGPGVPGVPGLGLTSPTGLQQPGNQPFGPGGPGTQPFGAGGPAKP